MEKVTDEEIEELERKLEMLEVTSMSKEDFWKELFKTNKETTKLSKIEKAYLNAIITILLKKDINYLEKLYRKLKELS